MTLVDGIVKQDNRSFSQQSEDHSKQTRFQGALEGVQFQLRQARSALLFVGMKLQDTDRPEIVVSDLQLVDAAEEALKELQVRVRDILASIDLDASVPVERQAAR